MRASAIWRSLRSDKRPDGRESSQLAIKEFARATVGKGCGGGIVVRPIMPGEGMILAWIAVNCRVWFPGQCRFNRSLCSLGNKLILLGQMHEKRRMKPIDLSQIFVGVAAVIGDGSVDAV